MTEHKKKFLQIKRRTLMFAAGSVYTIGGGILMARGLVALIQLHLHLPAEIIIGLFGGIGFYFAMFRKISKKHIVRISGIQEAFPNFFSFFGTRSYVLMAIMITAGVTVRMTGLVNVEYLYTFYVTMALPLLISAVRFFVHWSKNKQL